MLFHVSPARTFFFYQDCKLLKVQHCTCLPFVNDLDLLRKKSNSEKSYGLVASPYPLVVANASVKHG